MSPRTRKQIERDLQDEASARFLSAKTREEELSPRKKTQFSIDWRLPSVLAPIFDRPMGERLRNARMFLGWDQGAIAEKLGVNRHTISNIELGRPVLASISLANLMNVFENEIHYILFGSSSAKFESPRVKLEYWNYRLKNRKNKGKSLY